MTLPEDGMWLPTGGKLKMSHTHNLLDTRRTQKKKKND